MSLFRMDPDEQLNKDDCLRVLEMIKSWGRDSKSRVRDRLMHAVVERLIYLARVEEPKYGSDGTDDGDEPDGKITREEHVPESS